MSLVSTPAATVEFDIFPQGGFTSLSALPTAPNPRAQPPPFALAQPHFRPELPIKRAVSLSRLASHSRTMPPFRPKHHFRSQPHTMPQSSSSLSPFSCPASYLHLECKPIFINTCTCPSSTLCGIPTISSNDYKTSCWNSLTQNSNRRNCSVSPSLWLNFCC
ncbi:unnamed protein product [Prunus armeniaca]|uniref:Uncharacterized protein n=1 Tax=Prunus armeniaca TaxID=36596 RepID=A0A6J5XCU3_PRUAR|nr:unnamed protein product [Prunus armeniaca]